MTERKCFVFKFADIEVREREFLLIKAGERIAVEPKAFRVLLYLLRNPGRLISKDEIVAAVWNGSAVSDNSLTRSIAQLRRVLGDDSREPLYIVTVPTVGYRFLCEVSSAEDEFGTSARADAASNGLRDQAVVEGDLAREVEEAPQRVRGTGSASSRRRLFVGVVAGLLAPIVFFLVWWAMGRKATPGRQAIAYPLFEQRVTSNPPEVPIRCAIVSPDGKYLAYADPTGLYLRQMSTGETRRWSLPKGFEAWPNSWFPDSTHLLAVSFELQAQDPNEFWKGSLYKLSLLGGEPQKIMDNAGAGSVSPDGSSIAYLQGPEIGSELWVMDTDGAHARKVMAAGLLDKPGSHGSWFFPPVWSPDGKRIAYIEGHKLVGSDPREPASSLFTVNADGSGAIAALMDSRIGQALWWVPDGRILFAYHESASSVRNDDGIYSIRIGDRTRKAAAPPQQITQAEGSISGLSATADGRRLVLRRTNEPTEVFIAKYDAHTRQFKEPRRLTLDGNDNVGSAWTFDSKAVLFASNRSGTWKLFKQAIDETTPEALVEAPAILLPRLSPDGSQALYLTTSGGDSVSGAPSSSFRSSLMSKPLAGGPPHLIVQDDGIINYGCARAPSKTCIYSKLTGQDLSFFSFDLLGGKGQELSSIKSDLRNWVVSPDGSKLAIVLTRHRIRFLTLATGVAHDVTVKDWPLESVDWSADSKTVFMPSITPTEVPVILEVDQAGNAHVALQGVASAGLDAMIQSPDGQYGLLLALTPAENNAWMVDNF